MALAIAGSSMPTLVGTNAAYAGTIATTGATGACVWEFASMPPGFVATPANGNATSVTITSPAGSGRDVAKYSIVAMVHDGGGNIATQTFTVYIADPPTLSSSSIPATAKTGIPYAGRPTVTGGIPPYTFSTLSGTLPTGVLLTASTGILAGTPSSAGTSSGLKLRVTDAAGQTADTGSFAIIVGAGATALAIATSPTTTARETSAYTSQSKAGGGSGTGYTFSIASGALPAGLTLNTSSGLVSGAPTSGNAGSYTVAIRVTDSLGATATSPAFTIVVAPASVIGCTTGIGATVNVGASGYSQQHTGIGGSGVFTFSVVSGLPPGMSMNASTGVLSGTPYKSGVYSVIVRATDTSGGAFGDCASYKITVVSKARRQQGSVTGLY